jgi:hypothetical protein
MSSSNTNGNGKTRCTGIILRQILRILAKLLDTPQKINRRMKSCLMAFETQLSVAVRSIFKRSIR